MTERNLNPPDEIGDFPVYWPKGYRGFTLANYMISEITGGDTVFFRSQQVRHVVHGTLFCQAEIDLRRNPFLKSPASFEQLALLPGSEFRIVTLEGTTLAEWIMCYERRCADFRVPRNHCEDDGINDVGCI